MYRGKTFLAVIPARKHSRRVPLKNCMRLCGRSLVGYVAEAINKSEIFDRVIISTDSQEIADFAKLYHVEVPFMRPKELANHDALVSDVMVHALREINEKFDYVLLLSPTTPLVKNWDIRNAAKMLIKKDADMIVSVTNADYNSAYHSFELPTDWSLKGIVGHALTKSSQMPAMYCLNGGIYLGKYEIFAEKKDYYQTKVFGYYMPRERSIDIDTHWDVYLAECLLGKKNVRRRGFWKSLCRVLSH